MVLWEITLATAYFLGLKRTYRLALRLQRRLVSPKHPRIRLFIHGRTRAIFDMAVKVHQSIQDRDIEVGRNLGNWILRGLDKMKPSAQIRGPPPAKSTIGGGTSRNTINQIQSSSLKLPENSRPLKEQKSSRRLFMSSPIILPQHFPTIAMMLRASNPVGNMTQYRNFSNSEKVRSNYPRGGGRFDGVIREDIRQWMLQK